MRTAGRPSLLNPASLKAQAPNLYKAKFTTTKGDFVIEVHREWAPLGADRFYNLVKNGFYDDATFFRVLKDFMAQFGIHGDPHVAAVDGIAADKSASWDELRVAVCEDRVGAGVVPC